MDIKQRKAERKAQFRKKIRKTIISIFVLLVIILGAGTVYVWYTGKNVDTSTMPEPFVYEPEKNIKPIQQAENLPVGASVQSLTSPVVPGTNASIIIKTNMNATCSISVIYDKTASKDSGLVDKSSGEYGSVSWSWTVDSTAPLGKWPVKVTCKKGEKSGVVIGDLEVVKEIKTTEDEN